MYIDTYVHAYSCYKKININKDSWSWTAHDQFYTLLKLAIYQYYIRTVDWVLGTKQKHLGCKKVRGQSEATLLIGMCDQKLWYQLRPRSCFTKTIFNSLNDIQ